MRKKWLALTAVVICLSMAFAMVGCGKKGKATEDFVNGGFETGDLTGWTATGTAFGSYGVQSDDRVGVVSVGHIGNYWYNSTVMNAQFTGTLTSDTFKLTGTGKIGFMLGGGKSQDKCYVEFFVEGNDTPVLKMSNTDFQIPFVTDQLVRHIADLSEYVGKNVYVKITDNDKGDADEYAYLNLDDFKVLKTEADVTAAEAERKAILDEIGAPAFEEDETETAIRNGGFEEDLTNWLILEGNAFGKSCIMDASETFFGSREYHAAGNKFFSGYGSGNEAATGSMRSAKFTLAGDGFISMLVGGSKNKNSYVAVCGADGEELYTVYPQEFFKDPELSHNLARVYIDASEHLGEVLYVKIVDHDSRPNDFASINVDDISVSLTEADTKALMKETYEWAMSLEANAVNNYIRNYYETYDYPFNLDVLRVKTKAVSKAIYAADSVDLTEYVKDVAGEYGDVPASDITVAIKSVGFGGQETTSGFETFDMSEPGVYTVTYYVEYNDMTAEETFIVDVAPEGQVLNGGFETGNFEGWTLSRKGEDGTVEISEAEVFWEGDANFKDQNGKTVQYYHREGKYFLLTDDPATMSLKSSEFTLSGHGIISFKLGAKGVVKLMDAADNKVLMSVDNENLTFKDPTMAQSMQRIFLDASAHLNKKCYILVEDAKTTGVGLIAFDSLKVSLTYDEAVAMLDADKVWAASYRTDVLESDAQMGGQAKNIVKAQHDYYENLTVIDPRVLTIRKKISDKAGQVNTVIDLTAYLAEMEGYKLGTDVSALTKAIVKVEQGGEVVWEDTFNEFMTPDGGEYVVTYSLTDAESTITDTFKLLIASENEVVNGGFETGNLSGWTVVSGDAFGEGSVISDSVYWDNKDFNQEGKYHLDGWTPGEKNKGVLRSSAFTLGGNGTMSFRFGGASGNKDVYVSVCKEDGTEIARFANPKANAETGEGYMYVYAFDLTSVAALGDKLYIKIVDASEGGWGLGFFDDFKTFHDADSMAALGELNTDYFTAVNTLKA